VRAAAEKKRGLPVHHAPYHRFADFIDRSKDRWTILNELFIELDFHYSVVPFAGSRHFFVSSRSKERPRTVLAAHYDSVADSPGANDNASSVFMLIHTAIELYRQRAAPPWLFIFTDNEETDAERGIQAQGAYLLGRGLKNTALCAADFYVLDSSGRGDTLVISTMADSLMKKEQGGGIASAQKRLHDLRNNALAAAERSAIRNFMLLPAPFSDDAGFLYAGLSAQMLTVLPAAEAAAFASLSRSQPRYVRALTSREERQGLDMSLLPETWSLINTPRDTPESLTPEHLSGFLSFTRALVYG
jgi:hypothetical protein